MNQEFFHGHGLNVIDGKNRLSIPSEFRDAIVARTGTKNLFIGPATGLDCLIGYDASYAQRLQARLDRADLDEETPAGAMRATFLFGSAKPFTIDDAGRIVLSAGLKELGDFQNHVWFVAGGNWFQLWNPYRYLEQPGLEPRMIRILRREMEARGLSATEVRA